MQVTTAHGYDHDYLSEEYDVRLFFGVWRPVFQQYHLEALGMSQKDLSLWEEWPKYSLDYIRVYDFDED